jgi:murein DD-endopeptidase MepM/ murein hydrolase activator NlpD
MSKESKYNYKYGKPHAVKDERDSRKLSFKSLGDKVRELLPSKKLNFDLKLSSKKLNTSKNKFSKLTLPKVKLPEFNFKSKFEKFSDSLSGLHKNKFFLGSLALLIVFAIALTTYNYFSNKHYIIYADGEPIGFVRDEAQLELMMGILHDYGPSSEEDMYITALEEYYAEPTDEQQLLEDPVDPGVTDETEAEEESEADIGTMDFGVASVELTEGDEELKIEDVIDVNSSNHRYNVVTQITTELVYEEPEDLSELTLTQLKNSVYIETGAAVIVINGEEIAALKDYATAENLLEIIISSYLTERGGSELLDHKVQEDIDIVVKPVPPEDIIPRDMALNLLSTGYTERQVHVVQRGDSLWSIGNKNGMTVSQVKECNPELTSNILHIGQEIAIEPLIPYVHVETFEKIKTTEYIPFNTTYTKDSSMYTWQSRTVTDGVRGRNEVIYEIVRVNGVEKAREKVSTERISDPVTRVIAQGTKVPEATGTGSFIWPVDGGGSITSPFGYTRGRYHHGIDIGCSTGTRIFAADDGIVTTSAYHRTYGYYIIIDHGNGFSTLYAHNSRLLKSLGSKVSKGDIIAYSGSTGNSTGPHLHFEIRLNGNHQNPMNYFRR